MSDLETEREFWHSWVKRLQDADWEDYREPYNVFLEALEPGAKVTVDHIQEAQSWGSGLDCAGIGNVSQGFYDLADWFKRALRDQTDPVESGSERIHS